MERSDETHSRGEILKARSPSWDPEALSRLQADRERL